MNGERRFQCSVDKSACPTARESAMIRLKRGFRISSIGLALMTYVGMCVLKSN